MDVIEKYYGKQTFALYSLFVAVPGKKAWPRKIFVTFGIFVLSISTTLEILKIVTKKFQFQIVLQVLPGTAALGGTLLYLLYTAYTPSDKYKLILSVMLTDLQEKRTAEEETIKRQYAKDVKSFIDKYTKMFLLTTFVLPLSGFVPHVLDLLSPLNHTRERQFIFEGESSFIPETYFYCIYFLESCSLSMICILVGATENMTVIFGQHACGMFAVIGHQLENLTRFEETQLPAEVNYADAIERKLHVCIERHQRTLRFTAITADVYDIPLTIVLIGTFCTLSVSLVLITDPELINMKMVVFTIIQVVQFFIISSMGQNLIDKSEELSFRAYSAHWYVSPISVRRLLRMIIQKSSKPCEVVARSMYTLSIENFMSVIRTATSFFMVLRQS